MKKTTPEVIYQDGTFTLPPVKSPHKTAAERARDYEQRGLVAMDNDEYRKADIYFAWASLERPGNLS